MRIKNYNLFRESNQSEEEIAEICKRFRIDNWSINSEGLVDVDGSVDIYLPLIYTTSEIKEWPLPTKLPLNFGVISGHFICSYNQLTTLEGCPREVGRNFRCDNNKLTSLIGAPKKIGGYFKCNNNQLVNLIGGPEIVIGSYNARDNKINSFEGFPEDFDQDFSFFGNPVQDILDQFPKGLRLKTIHLINDYDAIWNGEVIEERLEMVKEKLGLS